jgi:hypothetical protein
MNALSRFSFAAEKALARELTQRLVKEVPPSLVENKRKLLSVNKVTRLLETSFQVATDFQVEHKIGFIRRAALANAFKWELKEGGYPEDFVEMATEGLVVALAKANRPAAPKA